MSVSKANRTLNLKAGEWVQVRSKEEILATLDAKGKLDHLQFMPEMLQYCGKRLRVYKRSDKTCEYTQRWSIRRVVDTVHLEGVRCDGSGHDGCQASCLIFWKEAWLKRAPAGLVMPEASNLSSAKADQLVSICSEGSIYAASFERNTENEKIFACQATNVPEFTSHMSFWDPRQYIRDLRSGNLDTGLAGTSKGHRFLEMLLAVLRLLQASIIGYFNDLQNRHRGPHYPFIEGTAEKTPLEVLNLQPGELVEVRTKEEIFATLDKSQKNRGLWFDSEMLPYCGGIYRVLRRVHRIIDERTRKMVVMKNPCIVLEGVICKSEYHRLCPRAIYPYWRESWLRRVTIPAPPEKGNSLPETCEHASATNC